MTWLRWDAEAAFSDVVDDLAEAMQLPPYAVFGLYVATCLGFGRHRPDGMVTEVKDSAIEGWARWKGKAGRWAAAFRARCTDDSGAIRGWWRNSAVLRKQERDSRRPDGRKRIPRESPDNPARDLEGIRGGNEDVDVTDTETKLYNGLRGRLAKALVGHPQRYTVLGFLETLPPKENPDAWAGVLSGCLAGLGTEQGRKATIEDLAAACTHFATQPPAAWKPAHFVSWVDRVIGKRLRPRSSEIRLPKGTATERAIAAAREFAEGGS